ncbi:MAG: SRPBCC domain-containing protein [Alphaproteobacteria bacterium]
MTTLMLTRKIAARPSIVFDALTNAESIMHWWCPDTGEVLAAKTDLRVGGSFRVRFRKIDGSEHETYGEYLEIERPQRLVMSWRWVGGREDPGESRVEITLRAEGDHAELTLVHSKLDNEGTLSSHLNGWNGALDKLEAAIQRRGVQAQVREMEDNP